MSLTLHTDFYEINMAYTFYKDNIHEKKAVFELYFRKNPFDNGYAVFCGLQRVIEYIKQFKFHEEDIEYLKTFGYDQSFLDYLAELKFTGSIKSVIEGEVVFAKEPLMIIVAPLIQAQLIETALLNIVNFQTLIATKASRLRNLVKKDGLYEFGARRAQEIDAALWGTRAAYIGGFDATSLVEAGRKFNMPIIGTHSHSFVQAYQDEEIAFEKYALNHPNSTFLVDTYNTLKSGLPKAIKVATKLKGHINFNAIRIDSGDLSYQSKQARKMLDDAGFKDTKIVVSNDLDEDTIASLILEDAKIDSYGVGTKIITSYNQPALGGVYKLVAIQGSGDEMIDVIKISDNVEKITTPGHKKVYRVINNLKNRSEGDYVCLINEEIDNTLPLKMFDENNELLSKLINNYKLIEIHKDIFVNGELVYELPTTLECKAYHQASAKLIWNEHKRFKNPAKYYVDLSEACFENKKFLIRKHQTSYKK